MKKEKQISCHSRVFLSGISTLIKQSGGDPRLQASGMTKGKINSHSRVFLSGISPLYPSPVAEKVCGGLYPSPLAGEGRVRGFTLLEILVAVLIIGVLVAVAVPQYQKAVLKSRFSSLMPLGKALHDGNESYYLEHGSYTNDPTKLDVKSNDSHAQITLGNQDKHKYVLLTRNDMNNNLVMYQKNSKYFPGEVHCEAEKDNAQANWLCGEGLKGTLLTERALSDGYNTYLLEGEGNGGFPQTQLNARETVLERGDSCFSTIGHASDNSQAGCWKVTITDGVCLQSTARYSCNDSTFFNSACEGGKAAYMCKSSNFNNGSVCEAMGGVQACSGAANDNRNAIFDNSTCNGYGGQASCTYGTFKNNSVCNGMSSCNFSDFDHSVCYGNNSTSCVHSSFKNGSVCYALVSYGPCRNISYDATSYCAGDYCPNNAPSGTAGKKWYRGTGEDWPADRPSELVDK